MKWFCRPIIKSLPNILRKYIKDLREYGLAWGCLPWQPRIASAPRGAGKAMAHQSPCTPAGPKPWQVGCYYNHAQVELPHWSPLPPIFYSAKKK